MPVDTKPEHAWLDQARALMLRGDLAGVESIITQALQSYPGSFELRRMLTGVYHQTGRGSAAELLLEDLHAERPGDAGTAFTLARVHIGHCRSAAAAAVIRKCFRYAQHDTQVVIQAIELLDGCGHKHDAAVIALNAITIDPHDPKLQAYAGMLEIQLGEFDRARAHYLFALEQAPEACEWHVPHELALMQRYVDAQHPDFERFYTCLRRDDLSARARSTLMLALAKACDDIGDYSQAAKLSRRANALAHAQTAWSPKLWRRTIAVRLSAPIIRSEMKPRPDFTPIFVVGVPRSGTTLVSQLLSRYPQVCNRGESPWLATLAQQAELAGTPDHQALQRAAATYAAQLQQDDTRTMRWFVDKQPLNFRYVDLILALFPDAKIIYCRRNARDTALSLWMQAFHEDVQGYACAFNDIALVMRDCERLMAYWQKRHPDHIREVFYEHLVGAPEETVSALATWVGIPCTPSLAKTTTPSSINTSSLWQARQPVYTSSTGRWRNYATYLPELLKLSADNPDSGTNQRPSDANIM